jgi:hypothetical protein
MADNLKSLLEGMGSTADEVAAFLEGQGCKGWRGTPYFCPVAQYLRLSGLTDPSVSTIMARERHKPDSIQMLPTPVHNFVLNFDFGFYPQLDKERT